MENFVPIHTPKKQFKKMKRFKNRIWSKYRQKYDDEIFTKDDFYTHINSLTNTGILRWKLLRCIAQRYTTCVCTRTSDTVCKAIHQRDRNATKNMMLIVDATKRALALGGRNRPECFVRKRQWVNCRFNAHGMREFL